jgi:hypothetical protein
MVEELRQALGEFKERFNRHWLLQRHGYATPSQVRQAFVPLGEGHDFCAKQCSKFLRLYSLDQPGQTLRLFSSPGNKPRATLTSYPTIASIHGWALQTVNSVEAVALTTSTWQRFTAV